MKILPDGSIEGTPEEVARYKRLTADNPTLPLPELPTVPAMPPVPPYKYAPFNPMWPQPAWYPPVWCTAQH